PTVDGFHVDDREYYFGMKTYEGKPKLLFRMFEVFDLDTINSMDWWNARDNKNQKVAAPSYVLITGGAGFIGVNLAHHLLNQEHKVIIYVNLSGEEVERNVRWLLGVYRQSDIWVEIADVRDALRLSQVVAQAKMVDHLAAQVAVTTSLF